MQPSSEITTNSSTLVCFEATHQGRFIVGLPWTYEVDGVTTTQTGLEPNCIDVTTTTKTSGTVEIQASAGGQAATVSLAVGANARPAPAASLAAHAGTTRHETTAGDRAALAGH